MDSFLSNIKIINSYRAIYYSTRRVFLEIETDTQYTFVASPPVPPNSDGATTARKLTKEQEQKAAPSNKLPLAQSS